VLDWEADVEPVIVLTPDGATDVPLTAPDEAATPEEAATDATEGATDEPAMEELTTPDDALTLATKVLAATLVRFTLAATV